MTAALLRIFRRWMDALTRKSYGAGPLERRLWFIRRYMSRGARLLMPWAFHVERRKAAAVMADSPPQPAGKEQVLFMSFRAWRSHTAWDLTIGQALRLRGTGSRFFFCGGGLPICEMGWPAQEEGRPCDSCGSYVKAMLDAARFPTVSMDELIPAEERLRLISKIRDQAFQNPERLEVEGVDLLPMVQQSLIWFFRTETLPESDEVSRAKCDFLCGAALVAVAATRLLDRVSPNVIVMVNGLFYEERIVREFASRKKIRVVTYEVGAQNGTLFFSGDSSIPAADYDITDIWEKNAECELTAAQQAKLEQVLESRARGGSLPFGTQPKPRKVEKTAGRRLVALFTNVSWDTAVTGKSYAFGSLFEWVAETIRLAGPRSDMELIIRIHPAEALLGGARTRENMADRIRKEFPTLPANIKIVRPSDPINSYSILEAADLVCVFSSTIGLEAAARGKPVCVVGKAHYRGRGFTTDVTSVRQYADLLAKSPGESLEAAWHARARRYAYWFFCRAMLPFSKVLHRQPGEPSFAFSQVAELAEGLDPALDRICDGILNGAPFELSANDPA